MYNNLFSDPKLTKTLAKHKSTKFPSKLLLEQTGLHSHIFTLNMKPVFPVVIFEMVILLKR